MYVHTYVYAYTHVISAITNTLAFVFEVHGLSGNVHWIARKIFDST